MKTLYSLRRMNLLIMLFLTTVLSCSDKGPFNFSDNLGFTEDVVVEPIPMDEEVTYEILKNSILENKCLGCHNANRARGGINLSTYEATLEGESEQGKVVVPGRSSESTLFLEVFNGTMPPRTPLSESEIDLIKRWIDTGAKKGGDGDSSPPPVDTSKPDFKTMAVDYENLKKFILKDKCIGCHNPERAKGEVDLSSYSSIFGFSVYFSTITEPGMPEQSALYTEVFKGSMPPRTKLSHDEIDYIRRWILEGAIEKKVEVLPLSQLPATYSNLKERILQDKCIRCHNPDKARADVDLSEYSKLFDYSEYFSLITEAGNPEGSSLYTEVSSGNMPPRNPLSKEEVEFVKRWIQEGAKE